MKVKIAVAVAPGDRYNAVGYNGFPCDMRKDAVDGLYEEWEGRTQIRWIEAEVPGYEEPVVVSVKVVEG